MGKDVQIIKCPWKSYIKEAYLVAASKLIKVCDDDSRRFKAFELLDRAMSYSGSINRVRAYLRLEIGVLIKWLNNWAGNFLRVKDYILRDLDIQKLADIFEQWSCLLKDMNFLLKNPRYIDQYFEIYSKSNAIELPNMRGNAHRTENQEAVARRYAEIDRESDANMPNLDSS